MSRERAPFVAQGTWRSGHLNVWGWNGTEAAKSSWLYSGFGHNVSGIGTTWHDSPVSYGELGRLTLELPAGGIRPVASVKLDPYGAAVWLSALPDVDHLSPSLAWFAGLTRFATRLVDAHNLTPVVDAGRDGNLVAKWQPLLTDDQREQLRYLSTIAPPACRNGSVSSVEEIVGELVDGMARAVLDEGGWRPDLGRRRDVMVQAQRGVFAALAKRDPTIRSGPAEFENAVRRLGEQLDRHRRRLEGEPIVVSRLRLELPEDPLDDWIVRLELTDETDPGRWCSAEDAWNQTPLAIDLAGNVDNLPLLDSAATDALNRLIDAGVYGFDDLSADDRRGRIELDLDQAEEFLQLAPGELDAIGIDLIGPEHLVKAKIKVHGEATEQPADDRRSRFGKEALVDWEALIDDTPVSEADLARAVEAGRTLMRAGHRWVRIDQATLRRARTFLEDHANRSLGAIDLLRLSADADDLIGGDDDGEDDRADGDGLWGGLPVTLERAGEATGWVDLLLDGVPDAKLSEATEPDAFGGELRHYQRRALAWLQFLAELDLGGVLADDMGLGKTATALAHIMDRPGPHLVISPLSVVHNWQEEARRFAPSMTTVVHHGTGRSVGDPSLFGLGDADLVITTYGLINRDLDTLGAIDWTTVILDEAQNVKNPKTKAAKAIRKLRATQKLALTGTPVENRLSELWSILDAVNPGMLGSLPRFRERYAAPIERNTDPDAAERATARLRTLTAPFILRRTKADRTLLPDLPDKIEQVAYASLTAEQATLYQQVVDRLLDDAAQLDGMQRRGRVLAALTRLKQVCNHPVHALKDGTRLEGRSGKLNRFDELVDGLLDIGERGLVFTQFREMGDLLQTHIANRWDTPVDFLHGGVGRSQRDAMVARFQSDAAAPLLIVSLKAGGTGLNLTNASHVIHYDRWWNPAVEDQATDRAWRFGQERTVMVHKLVCQGTVEERIGEVIDEKRSLAEAVIGNGEAWISELSTDELAELVRLEVRQ